MQTHENYEANRGAKASQVAPPLRRSKGAEFPARSDPSHMPSSKQHTEALSDQRHHGPPAIQPLVVDAAKVQAAGIDSAALLSMQRLAGNAAVGDLLAVSRQSDAGADDKEKRWQDAKGQELVDQMGGYVQQWVAWRASPVTGSFDKMPGKDAAALVEKYHETFEKDPSLKERASMELLKVAGSTALTYLQEMVCMWPADFADVGAVFNGVRFGLDPGHHYTLDTAAQGEISFSDDLIKKGVEKITQVAINQLNVRYENNFGWFWNQNIDIVGVQFQVGVSMEPGNEKEGSQPKLSAGPGSLSVDIKGKVEADKQTPPRYWGWTDFDKTEVRAADPGASAEVKLAGAGIAPGVHIPFVTFPGLDNLAFKQLVSGLEPSWPTLGGAWQAIVKEKPLTFKLSLGSVGEGVALTRGAADVQVYQLQSELRWTSHEDRPWKLTITGFDTGQASVPSAGLDQLTVLLEQVRTASAKTLAQVEMMTNIQVSRDPATYFKAHVQVNGYSSRVWRGARGAAEQRERNAVLSSERANTVAGPIEARLADCAAVAVDSKTGVGPSVVVPGTGGGTAVPVADDEAANVLWHQEWDAWEKENYENDHSPTPEEKKAKVKELDDCYSKTSNDPLARRVEIVIWYEGKEIFGKLPSMTPVDAPFPFREAHPGEFNEPDATVPDATVP